MSLQILLIEDHKGDRELAQETFALSGIPHTLHSCINGAEALAFLGKRGRFVKAPTPNIIFLDIHLPRKNGWHVLAAVRENKTLATIPVIILTTHLSNTDVCRAYVNGANAYLAKPISKETYQETLLKALHFWLEIVHLPLDCL